ncbi:Pol Polyprotein [Phytophthora megakarya]|uniref:Pol Polyprotein n=1 Tax=Phytophthora megakarya TaxID=4795 RepID=A0A225W647_9STRA|nr:Pol Polyprotein [Phytophthora megakarya]
MGLSCSPAAFNRLIRKVVADQGSFCNAYFVDLFAYTDTNDLEDHLDTLEKVLERCNEEQLYIKLSKCTFCASEIPCLGDFIGIPGIRMDPDNVRVILNGPKPRTKRELQSFLGTYFAEYSAPLTEITKGKTRNEQLQFNELHRQCFEELKPRLSKPPFLVHPDFDRILPVKMDASNFVIAGYLYQFDDVGEARDIAYGGRRLSEAELKYPTRENKTLAALFSMRIWQVYLIDKPFMIRTDHHTLEHILQQKTCSQRLARWLNELGMFQPLFKWIKGDANLDTTAISLAALLKHIRGDNESNGVSTHLDRCFGPIVEQLRAKLNTEAAPPDAELPKSANIDNNELQDTRLFFRSHSSQDRRLCVPDNRELRDRILIEEHDSVVRGPLGSSKTLTFMQQKYH